MTWLQYDHADDLPTSQRKTAQFRSSIEKTEQLLEVELENLKAGRALILTGHTDSDRTRTGRPSTDSRRLSVASTSSVRVTVADSKQGPLQWTASRFGDWTDNLRAIALTIENLRAIERYGATSGEQYRGFRALPAGDGGVMALQRLGEIAQIPAGSERPALEVLVQQARRRTHPDSPTANAALYAETITLARQLGLRV